MGQPSTGLVSRLRMGTYSRQERSRRGFCTYCFDLRRESVGKNEPRAAVQVTSWLCSLPEVLLCVFSACSKQPCVLRPLSHHTPWTEFSGAPQAVVASCCPHPSPDIRQSHTVVFRINNSSQGCWLSRGGKILQLVSAEYQAGDEQPPGSREALRRALGVGSPFSPGRVNLEDG